ncbi:MAG: hypothetical protein JO152_07110 [Mycobacteriaceae bacterium]|nr:hypothetical protein [Mycobacteriaceae bacterium]
MRGTANSGQQFQLPPMDRRPVGGTVRRLFASLDFKFDMWGAVSSSGPTLAAAPQPAPAAAPESAPTLNGKAKARKKAKS